MTKIRKWRRRPMAKNRSKITWSLFGKNASYKIFLATEKLQHLFWNNFST